MASEADPLHERKGRDMEGKMNASEIFRVPSETKLRFLGDKYSRGQQRNALSEVSEANSISDK